MEIKKATNCFGIKKLHKLINFDKNAVIFAPNGTFKTSFFNGRLYN